MALVGESGAGKSLTLAAVLGLLPRPLRASGRIEVDGDDIAHAGARHWRAVRGNTMGAVFQDPRSCLNPLSRVGPQLLEPLLSKGVDRGTARRRATETLRRMRLTDPDTVMRAYPTRLSGGQRQRVAIALALMNRPRLLVADEPTSALDVSVQSDVLDLLEDAVGEGALLFVTHDLAIGAHLCERIIVMHQGKIVEAGPAERILAEPHHDVTRSMVRAHEHLSLPPDLRPAQPVP